ncbi:MAG: hypothetical protein ACOYL6_07775 [Bacteriovoracaceae bacterium]
MSNVKVMNNGNVELEAAKRKTVEKRTNELKKVEEKYEISEREARLQNDQRLRELKDQGQVDYIAEIDHREERLSKVKESVDKTQEILAAEKERLGKGFEDSTEARKLNYEMKMRKIHEEHKHDGQTLNDKFNDELRNIFDSAQKEETIARTKISRDKNKVQRDYDTTMSNGYRTFTDQKFAQDVQNFAALDNQKNNFNSEFRAKESTHGSKFKSQEIRHKAELESESKQHELTTESTRLDFEKKYQGILAQQVENFATLQDNVDHNIAKTKIKETKTKESITNRSQDQFYQGSIVKTDIQDKGDHYIVKIPLPPHEASQVNLSGHERNLKLTFSRMAETDVKMEDGSVNKTKRSESMVKQLAVADIINPKKIEKSYADGLVTYKIGKL